MQKQQLLYTRLAITRPNIGLINSLFAAKYIDLYFLFDYSTYFKDVIQFYYCQFTPVSS